MPNPLLNPAQMPSFSDIIPDVHIESALQEILTDNRRKLTTLCEQLDFTWENLLVPLEEMADRLDKMWSTVSYLKNVRETESLRAIYNRCEPLINDYDTEFYQNTRLFAALKQITERADFVTLSAAQQRVITNLLRDFKLAGVDLPLEKKQRLAEVMTLLEKAKTEFEEHVLDATDAWTLHITERDALQGLSEETFSNAATEAKKRELNGWVLTLKDPVVDAVMRFAKNRELRRKIYYAISNLASDLGADKEKYDNTPVIERIMALRHEMANLLGFDNFANYALAKNIASEPQRVLDFLNRLATESYTVAKKEFAEVVALATDDGIADFGRWDLRYYSERLREQKYQYAESDIKPYFPLDKVLTGYFTILNKLYGLTIESVTPPDTWHPDVRYFKVYDENQVFRGGIFVDFFARENKIGGAWANVARARRKLPDGTVQYPIAHLLTNFAAPSDGQPSLLSEEEVMTVFHEFGHCLHTVLTQIEYREISGMAGIPVDGIEFPSQFMEYFCIQKEIMPYISGHYQTGECLPDHLMQRMTAARQFQSALFMIRQVEYALVDFRLHLEYDPAQGARTEAILKSVQNAVAVVPTPPDANRLTHSFTHIFSSGYAAGYYSYKWAEVLSCDAFLRFEEEGLLNPKVGRDFLHLILEQGGLPNLMDAFVQFRGREPRVEALLHYAGLKSLPDISAKGKMLAPLLFKQNTVVSDEKQAALSPAAQFK